MIELFERWLKPAIIVATLAGLLLLAAGLSPAAAQGPPPRPTPTNVGGEPDEAGPPPVPQIAGVSGFVYDFSSGASPSPGVIVVIEGDGWSLETVTDSAGHYAFAGLGAGLAVLNLRLPAGAQPVAPNWPVFTNSQAHVTVNLGFVWGESRPLPVVLRGGAEPVVAPLGSQVALVYEIENRTSETATNGLLDVKLPPALQATRAEANQGVVDFSARRVQLLLEDLPAGSIVTLRVEATVARLASLVQTTATEIAAPRALVYAAFTYDQMIAPQALQSGPLTTEGQPAAPAAQAAAQPTGPAQPTPDLPTTGGVITPEPPPSPAAATQPGPAPASTATPVPEVAAPSTSAGEPAESGENLIPTTGQGSPGVAPPIIWVSLLLLVGLGAAGITALRSNRPG